jgi:hypothetical protein
MSDTCVAIFVKCATLLVNIIIVNALHLIKYAVNRDLSELFLSI